MGYPKKGHADYSTATRIATSMPPRRLMASRAVLPDQAASAISLTPCASTSPRQCASASPARIGVAVKLRRILHGKWQTAPAKWATIILHRDFRIRAPIAATIAAQARIKRTDMNERQERLAREREEIAIRVANFRATQEKFRREREEYCVTTLQNARSGSERPSSWWKSPFRSDGMESEM
jgi:hypothetical protein